MQTLSKSQYVYVLLILLAIVCFFGLLISIKTNRSFVEEINWVEHTYQVLYKAEQVKSNIFALNVTRRVYLSGRTQAALRDVDSAVAVAFGHMDSLALLTADNESQQLRIATLKQYAQERVLLFRQLVSGGQTNMSEVFLNNTPVPRVMQRLIEEIKEEELRLLAQRKTQSSHTQRYFNTFFWVLMVAALLLLALAALVVAYNRRLEKKLLERNRQVLLLNEELSANERKFRGLTENSNDLVLLVNREGKILYCSPSAQRILGWTPEKITRTLLRTQVHPEELGKLHRLFAQSLKEPGQNLHVLFRIRNITGAYRWLQGMFVNLLHEPSLNGILFNLHDVTQRREAEEQTARSEQIYCTIASSIPGSLICLMDKDYRFFLIEGDLLEKIGYTKDILLNKTVEEAVPQHRQQFAFELWRPALNGEVFTTEISYPNLDMLARFLPLKNDSQEVFGAMMVGIDVTELKNTQRELIRSESIYKSIAASIPGSVITLLDKNYKHLLIEGDLLPRLGYNKEDLLHKPLEEVMTPERYTFQKPNWDRALEGESFSLETQINGLDMLTRYVPLRDQSDEIFAIMIVAIDVTNLKNAQRELAHLNTVLEERIEERTGQLAAANKELEAFSYSVSHDLRAPLRAVSGYANILGEDYQEKLDEEGQRILKKIQTSAAQMGMLIDDLLSFSRLGKKEISFARLNMDGLVSEVLHELGSGGNEPYKVVVQQPLPPATGDHTAMRQVLTNLISNAIKYSSRNPQPVIQIKGVEEAAQTVYSVSDNGVGFDMRYAHKLFGVFQRLHATHEFPGTGVGLAVVQRIIHKHNGQVWAHSELGKGAAFYFSLPHQKV